MSAEAERVAHNDIDFGLTGLVWHKIHFNIASLVLVFQVDSRGDEGLFDGFNTCYQLNGTTGPEQMAGAAFR